MRWSEYILITTIWSKGGVISLTTHRLFVSLLVSCMNSGTLLIVWVFFSQLTDSSPGGGVGILHVVVMLTASFTDLLINQFSRCPNTTQAKVQAFKLLASSAPANTMMLSESAEEYLHLSWVNYLILNICWMTPSGIRALLSTHYTFL